MPNDNPLWTDLIIHREEPLKAKTPQEVSNDNKTERYVTWEEAREEMKHYEQRHGRKTRRNS